MRMWQYIDAIRRMPVPRIVGVRGVPSCGSPVRASLHQLFNLSSITPAAVIVLSMFEQRCAAFFTVLKSIVSTKLWWDKGAYDLHETAQNLIQYGRQPH